MNSSTDRTLDGCSYVTCYSDDQRRSEHKFHKTTHTIMIFTDDLFVLAFLSEDEEIGGKRGLEYNWQCDI